MGCIKQDYCNGLYEWNTDVSFYRATNSEEMCKAMSLNLMKKTNATIAAMKSYPWKPQHCKKAFAQVRICPTKILKKMGASKHLIANNKELRRFRKQLRKKYEKRRKKSRRRKKKGKPGKRQGGHHGRRSHRNSNGKRRRRKRRRHRV